MIKTQVLWAKAIEKPLVRKKVYGASGRRIYHTYILSVQRLMSGGKKKVKPDLKMVPYIKDTFGGFIHQFQLWCPIIPIRWVIQEKPTLQIIKDWWGVKDRGAENFVSPSKVVGRGAFYSVNIFSTSGKCNAMLYYCWIERSDPPEFSGNLQMQHFCYTD